MTNHRISDQTLRTISAISACAPDDERELLKLQQIAEDIAIGRQPETFNLEEVTEGRR